MAMPPMPPQGGPAQPPAQEEGPGGASQLVSEIFSGMQKLKELMVGSGAAGDDDMMKLDQIAQGFEAFVEGLGGASEPKPEHKGPMTMETGGKGGMPAL
jgi:hypothetical protein